MSESREIVIKRSRLIVQPGVRGERLRHLAANARAVARFLGVELRASVPEEVIEEVRRTFERGGGGASFDPMGRGERFLEGLLRRGTGLDETELLMVGHRRIPTGRRIEGAAATLLRHARGPVLVLPVASELPWPPFRSLLVAMSAERARSESLQAALTLAMRAGLPVDLVHVASEGHRTGEAMHEKGCALAFWGDALHHEIPARMRAFIAQACPYASLHELRAVREFHHLRGEVSATLEELLGRRPGGLLVIEWKGELERGRALTMRSMLARHAEYPVLLIKARVRTPSYLKLPGTRRAA